MKEDGRKGKKGDKNGGVPESDAIRYNTNTLPQTRETENRGTGKLSPSLSGAFTLGRGRKQGTENEVEVLGNTHARPTQKFLL